MNKDKVMASAQKLIQQGKLDKAIKELQRLLEEDPKDVRTLLKIGDLYTKKGDRNEATQTYLKVAEFYSEQGFYLKSVAVYKQILRVDPNLVDVNLKLAELYHQLGLMNDSVAQYQLVANALDRAGKTKESLAIIKKMVDLDPENVASRIKLAELYSGQHMIPEAVKEFETACTQLQKQERTDDYVKVAERLLYHDGTRMEVARELARLYLQRADPKRALAKLQLCFKANSKDIDTLNLLAQAFVDMQQPSKSVSVLRELAKNYAALGRAEESEATWQRVLAIMPEDQDAKRALGMMPAAPAPSGFEDDVQPSFIGAFPSGNSVILQVSRPLGSLGSPSGATGDIAVNVTVPPSAGIPPMSDPGTGGEEYLGDASPSAFPPPARAPAAPPMPRSLAAEEPAPSYPAPQPPPPPSPPPAFAPATAQEENPETLRLLGEADVFLRFGLREKATNHVRRALEVDGESLAAHDRLKGLLIKAGNTEGAAEEVVTCFRIAMARGDRARARAFLADLASIHSVHAALPVMRGDLDGTPTVAPVVIRVIRRELPPAALPTGAEGDADGPSADEALVSVMLVPGDVDPAAADSAGEQGFGQEGGGYPEDPFGPAPVMEGGIPPEDGSQAVLATDAFSAGDVALIASPMDDMGLPPGDDGLAMGFPSGAESLDADGGMDMSLNTAALDAAVVDQALQDGVNISGEMPDFASRVVPEPPPGPELPPDDEGGIAAPDDWPDQQAEAMDGSYDGVDPFADAASDFLAPDPDQQPQGLDGAVEPRMEDEAGDLAAPPPPAEEEDGGEVLRTEVLPAEAEAEPPAQAPSFALPPVLAEDLPPVVAKPAPTKLPFAPPPPPAPPVGAGPPAVAVPPPAQKPVPVKAPVPVASDLPVARTVAPAPAPSTAAAAKPVPAKAAPLAIPAAPPKTAPPPIVVPPVRPAAVPAKPDPVAAKPGPVAAKPAPVAAKPAPVAAKPAPVAPKPPPPVEEGPDPAEEFFPDEINEAGFFVEQGLYDEAREILQVILEDLPDSPKANRLMRKLDALERGESPPDENAAPAAPEEDGSVSLAQELEEEFSGILPAEQQDEPVQISVDEVLAEFKKGVDKQLSQDDVDARHDLGIAYKEMGLFDDAVAEFERSSRGPRKEADAWYLVGLCRLEQQQEREAVAAFQRALEAKVITDHQRNAIHFEMGSAHQALGELPEALLLFRQVAEADPMFKDVGQRLVELEGQGVVPAQGKRKAGPGPGNGTAPAAGAAGAGAKKGKNIGYI